LSGKSDNFFNDEASFNDLSQLEKILADSPDDILYPDLTDEQVNKKHWLVQIAAIFIMITCAGFVISLNLHFPKKGIQVEIVKKETPEVSKLAVVSKDSRGSSAHPSKKESLKLPVRQLPGSAVAYKALPEGKTIRLPIASFSQLKPLILRSKKNKITFRAARSQKPKNKEPITQHKSQEITKLSPSKSKAKNSPASIISDSPQITDEPTPTTTSDHIAKQTAVKPVAKPVVKPIAKQIAVKPVAKPVVVAKKYNPFFELSKNLNKGNNNGKISSN